MGRFGSIFKKDLILGFKDVWILLEIGAAFLIAGMLVFVVPKEIDRDATVFIQDQTGVFRMLAIQYGGDEAEEASQLFVDSREEVIEGMRKNRNAFGMIVSPRESGKMHVEMLTQPYSSEAITNFLEVQMKDVFTMLSSAGTSYSREVLEKVEIRSLSDMVRDDVPFNKRMVPIILMFIVGLMGMFTMISLIGQERSDQIIRAYKVSPAKLLTFITSKHLLLVLISTITFSTVYLITVGFEGYLKGLLVIIPTVVFGSAIGVMLGSFFDNPMGAIGWVFLFMILLALPGVSLFAPIFSPEWLKFLPTYYTIFGLDAAIFPDGYSNVIWISVGILTACAAVMLPISNLVFVRKIRKEF